MYYQVQVALDIEFTQLVVNKVVQQVTDYEVAKDLEPFTVYYWRVKTINALTGAKSAWSIPCAFRIKASDVVIDHEIDRYDCKDITGSGIGFNDGNPNLRNSYIVYGSNCFGLDHSFVRSYDVECIIPDAQIGYGLCNISGTAQIGECYCPGVCMPSWEGFDIEYILTEDNFILTTEDGVGLILEF